MPSPHRAGAVAGRLRHPGEEGAPVAVGDSGNRGPGRVLVRNRAPLAGPAGRDLAFRGDAFGPSRSFGAGTNAEPRHHRASGSIPHHPHGRLCPGETNHWTSVRSPLRPSMDGSDRAQRERARDRARGTPTSGEKPRSRGDRTVHETHGSPTSFKRRFRRRWSAMPHGRRTHDFRRGTPASVPPAPCRAHQRKRPVDRRAFRKLRGGCCHEDRGPHPMP